jgi:hypothetical protein
MSRIALAAIAALATAGCSIPPIRYAPQYVAEHELVLGYDDGYYLSAEGRYVAKGYRYDGLEEYVACVPEARRHARAAQANGSAAIPLQVVGATLAVGGLGGLGGLAYVGHDNRTAAALLAGGLGLQLIGLVLVGAGAQSKANANGHAIDAMNHYNDAVGSQGGSCHPTKRYW